MAITDTALKLRGLKDEKAALDARLKEIKVKIDIQEKKMAEEMIELEMQSINIGGYSYSLAAKEHYSCLAADREAALEAIRLFGYAAEDVYSSRFEVRTFEKIIKEIVEMHDGELPEELDGIVKPYEDIGISIRKA